MSRHRAVPDRPPPTVRRHRAVRPRYGRLVVALTSLAVTAIALLGGVGLLPSMATGSAPAAHDRTSGGSGRQASQAAFGVAASTSGSTSTTPTSSPTPTSTPSAATTAGAATGTPVASETGATTTPTRPAVPGDSGTGRRIVFSQAQQRVWLVDADEHVQRTYLVSGSVLDNLDPGTYHVYSRSRWAVGVQDSGVMQYFVRFTEGPTGAAIGFHSIPTKNGTPLQTRRQLGTPQSHGCIRQYQPDAIALWDFAPIGTEVDVVAG